MLARNKQYPFKTIYYGIITPKITTEDSEYPIFVFIVKNGYAIVIEQVFILTNRTGKY